MEIHASIEHSNIKLSSKEHLKNYINYLCNSTNKYYNKHTRLNKLYRYISENITKDKNKSFVEYINFSNIEVCKNLSDELYSEIITTINDISFIQRDIIHFRSDEEITPQAWQDIIVADIESLVTQEIDDCNICYLTLHLNQEHGAHLHRTYF